ncbi:dynein beta chain, ciliary-like [Symsagittifera roscoffensis]|uniref:dynein beta chain, ciliary-like n=1 Tax=Symsagittifera roscoffensis TaxID=84072 RepID=UPI00307B29AC
MTDDDVASTVPEPDMRAEFITEYACQCFRINSLKVGSDEFKDTLLKFVDRQEYNVMVLSLPAGTPQPQIHFGWPSLDKIKSHKSVFFFKRRPNTVVPKEDFKLYLRYGELSTSVLNQLAVTSQRMYMPMISNNSNHLRWPKVVSRDLIDHTHQLNNRIYVVTGLILDQTVLTQPLGIENLNHRNIQYNNLTDSDRTLIHRIESTVIGWSHQLYSVLCTDSSQPLLEDKEPTPYVEIKFWQRKALNLQLIHDQMSKPDMVEMGEVLKQHDSAYYPSLQSLYSQVESGIEEARDISVHLKPLKFKLDSMQQEDFTDMGPHLKACMHTLALIWVHSRHYRTPGRIIVVLQEMCNLILSMASTLFSPTSPHQLHIINFTSSTSHHQLHLINFTSTTSPSIAKVFFLSPISNWFGKLRKKKYKQNCSTELSAFH